MTEAQRNRIAVNMERALERKAARVEENKEVTEQNKYICIGRGAGARVGGHQPTPARQYDARCSYCGSWDA